MFANLLLPFLPTQLRLHAGGTQSLVLHSIPFKELSGEEKRMLFWAPCQPWAEQGASWLEQKATGKT